MHNIFTFFASAALVVTVLLLFFVGAELTTAQTSAETAAQVGAHTSAISGGNMSDIQQAVLSTLTQEGLPTTWNGQSLINVSSNIQSASQSPTISVTVQYKMPTVITNIGGLVGDPNGMPGSFPIQATESYTNDTFFGG